ncbi:MAG: hypothetical protein E5Y58_33155 [Mesorhizobium sp.]|nr:MAG: hypothetical protein E5Y58_33155 [Mesorhizobium sp.]
MSPKSAQRFWVNDMHKNKDLKRVACIPSDTTRFSLELRAGVDCRQPLSPFAPTPEAASSG